MRKIITFTALVFCLKAKAQSDSTIVPNQAFQARLIEFLVPAILTPDNDEFYSTFIKWRTAFRATQPTGTTLVTIDAIPVNVIVHLYNYILQGQQGYGIATLYKSAIATARANNAYLNRLCNDLETESQNSFANQVLANRQLGRKYLLGKAE